MSTETTAILSQKLKAEAKKVFHRLQRASYLAKRNWFDIGRDGHEMKAKNLFSYLGFPDEDTCRSELRIGRSTWYRDIRIYKELCDHVPRKLLMQMTAENAEQITRLPVDKRKDKELHRLAIEKNEEELEKLVNKRIEKVRAEAAPGTDGGVPESRVWIKFRCYEGQAKKIEEAITKFCDDNELKDDRGQALELLCAEYTDRKSVATMLRRAVPALKEVHETLKNEHMAVEEKLEKIQKFFERGVMQLALGTGAAQAAAG